jgi:hypothetical protein
MVIFVYGVRNKNIKWMLIDERDWWAQGHMLDGLGCKVNFTHLTLILANKGRQWD